MTTVAQTSPGGYASFREPSLNDPGAVVFTADVQPDPEIFTTVQGVFTGPDPVGDKVLQAGDLYEGVPVTSVVSGSEALNNRGQIVMNGTQREPRRRSRGSQLRRAGHAAGGARITRSRGTGDQEGRHAIS